jgi:hypothetical protein
VSTTNDLHSPFAAEPPLLYHTPCRLELLINDYLACAEPLTSGAEDLACSHEVAEDFLALQSSTLAPQVSPLGGACGVPQGGSLAPQLGISTPPPRRVKEAAHSESESDLSEPDPPESQVNCQKQVQSMGGSSGGLWT